MSDSHEWDVDSESTEAEDLDSRIYFTAKTRVMPLCSASDASRTRLVAVVAPPAKTMHPELASTLSTTTLIATTPPVQDTVKDHGMHEDTTNTIDTDERPERALQHIRRTCNVRDWFRRNGVSDNEFEWAKATCGRVAVAVARVVVCLAAAVSVGDVVAAEGVTEPGPNAL
ncbi:hypothetical protein HDU83_005431 [Entophlyctis luteolus]|nr:hypothetical protein HDU83_005431 [Entophlyctis luteolus]